MNDADAADVRNDILTSLKGHEHELAPLRKSSILVTGGTGFLGSWLAEAVACLNDEHGFESHLSLLSRHPDSFLTSRPHLAGRSDMSLIRADIRDVHEVPEGTSWVIHAAANPDTRFHTSNPVETASVIAGGTAAVLEAVRRSSTIRKFLNVSSGLVYGPQPWDVPKVSETFHGASIPLGVGSVYAEAKRFGETYCDAARSQQRIPIVTARPFAFLGPYQSLASPWAVNNFVRDALGGQAIRILGDGQTVRSYLYGSDAAVWLLKILVAGPVGKAFNVGSPHGITLERVAGMIADACTPRPSIHLHASSSSSSVQRRSLLVPDVSAAATDLGLSVRIRLDASIARTIQWNRARTRASAPQVS